MRDASGTSSARAVPAEATGATSISVVVPVFNGESTVGELVRRIERALRPRADRFEILLVNDGSADRSWERILECARLHPEVRGIDLARNFGQHAALLAGIRAAENELIVTLDDDLQNPPEEIPRLLEALTPDREVVYGRPLKKRHPAHRRLGRVAVTGLLGAITRSRAPAQTSGFRAFRTGLRDRFGDNPGRLVTIDGLLRWSARGFGTVAVRHEPRRSGDSNYTLRSLGRIALAKAATTLRRPPQDTGRSSYAIRVDTGTAPIDFDARR
jgi:glycosyltransferase involved in cell wall biosynthesis